MSFRKFVMISHGQERETPTSNEAPRFAVLTRHKLALEIGEQEHAPALRVKLCLRNPSSTWRARIMRGRPHPLPPDHTFAGSSPRHDQAADTSICQSEKRIARSSWRQGSERQRRRRRVRRACEAWRDTGSVAVAALDRRQPNGRRGESEIWSGGAGGGVRNQKFQNSERIWGNLHGSGPGRA